MNATATAAPAPLKPHHGTMGELEYYYEIDTGPKHGRFTLWRVFIGRDIGMKRTYVRTLGNDRATSREIAARSIGVDIPLWMFDVPLVAVKQRGRRTAEQVAEDERAEAERLVLEEKRCAEEAAEREANRKAVDRAQIRIVEEGSWPFGKFMGESMKTSGDNAYARYWIDAGEAETDREGRPTEEVVKVMARVLRKLRGIGKLPEAKPDAPHLGTEGDKFSTLATVIRQFEFEGRFGWTTSTHYLAACGAYLVHFGTKPGAKTGAVGDEVGKQVTLSATVKRHGDYQGTNQTTITRPKHAA